MATRSLKTIRNQMPDWMDPDQIVETLDEIFAAADLGGDPPADVAETLLELMTRAAENPEWFSAADESRILAWVGKNWAYAPPAYFRTLGAIVVNLRCEEAGPYLADRAASAVDPTQKARLEALVKERAPSEAE